MVRGSRWFPAWAPEWDQVLDIELQTLDGTPFQSITVPSGGEALGFFAYDPFTSLVFRARAVP
jgi:hypothetical protein